MSDLLIKLLCTDAMIVLIIGIFVTYIIKWLASKDGERFKTYEGYAITAVKAAEKAIPDDAENKGLNRLNFALQAFLKQYEKATGVTPKAEEVAKIESWISTIHGALEGAGVLSK
jgi:hypothetical protein